MMDVLWALRVTRTRLLLCVFGANEIVLVWEFRIESRSASGKMAARFYFISSLIRSCAGARAHGSGPAEGAASGAGPWSEASLELSDSVE